jgi:hypothetical protein
VAIEAEAVEAEAIKEDKTKEVAIKTEANIEVKDAAIELKEEEVTIALVIGHRY